MSEAAVGRRVGYADVLADREFRALYVAQALSSLGDQLARIAVALLVFSRTHSALLTALSYAVTYLPWLVGGPLLSGYADRLPRQGVMVVCDLARAIVVLGVAVPHVPISAALVLVGLVALFEPPFSSARAALLPDVVGEGERYVVASSLSNTTNQFAQVVGFAIGGAVVTAITSRGAIVVDSATFVLSAYLVATRLRRRPAALAANAPRPRLTDGFRYVFSRRDLRAIVLLSWAVVFALIAPESIAVPYAAAHGGGALAAGLMTAAAPLGIAVGALWVSRGMTMAQAERALLPMALVGPAVLALTAFDPPLAVTWVLWAAGGAMAGMQITANRMFVAAVPRDIRGRAFGVAVTGLWAAQGLGALVAGFVSQHLGPAVAVADVALPALALTIVAALYWPRATQRAHLPTPGTLASPPPSDTLKPRHPAPVVWVYTVTLAATTAFVAPQLHGTAIAGTSLPQWWLLVMFTIVHAYPMHFEYRRQPRALQLEAVPLVLGLLFLTPVQLVLVRLVATAVAHGIIRRQPLIRLAYNVAATGAFTLCAVAVFRGFVPAGSGAHPAAWPACFVAVGVDELLSIVSVAAVVYVNERIFKLGETLRMLFFTLGVDVINAFLAVVTASAIIYDSATVWAITVFVVLWVMAFRTYHRLADRHASLDRLNEIARELGPVAAEPGDLAPALGQLRRVIRADRLELALLRDDPELATVVTVQAFDNTESIDVVDREIDDEHRARLAQAAQSGAAAVIRSVLLRERLRRRQEDRMVVAVGDADRPVALLTAQHRSGEVRGFDQNDYRLLDAAADHLSAALEKGRLVESLRWAATRDTLTGLANLDTLRSFLAAMLDGSSGGVLLLLNIDRFHDINDTLGHEAGDRVLAEVGRRLLDAPTHGALAARVGGDQFALALPGQSGSEVARLAALAVKSRIDGPLRLDDISADLRVTIGMARSPEHGSDATTLLRRAEMAMTAAKGTTSGIGEWEPSFEQDGSRRLQLLSGLRQALSEGALRVEYQPKLRLGTGEVVGFEALVRWRHPDLGPVSPAEFVPLAEASGLISALTSNVLRPALETCRHWHDVGKPVGIAVNISARSLDDPVLVGQVAALLTASGLDPQWLTLELTESSVMENPARSIDVLRQLRSLGVRLSIDDFGTGYSSLHYLRGLPVHEVKIDKTFVDNVDRDGADRAVIRAVVELCDSLGLTTIAEGVEQASQAYALESLGVQEVQGYFYGRPMPEEDALEWLLPRPTPTGERA